jgi:hypothetical protein
MANWREASRASAARRLARAEFLAQANHVLTALAWLIAGLLGAYLLAEAPRIHREAEQMRSAEADRESIDFCKKVGLHRHTAAFSACLSDLTEIRANQDRRRDEAAGFF